MKIANGLRICLRLDKANSQALIGTIRKGHGKKIGCVTKIMSVANLYEHPEDFVGTWYVLKILSAIFNPLDIGAKRADELFALRVKVTNSKGKEIPALPFDTRGLKITSLFE